MEFNYYFIILCCLAVAGIISFIWAFIGTYRKKRGFYYNLITICLAGIMLSKCIDVLFYIAGVDTYYFSIVDFGSASCMMFFVFATRYFLSKLRDESIPVSKPRKIIPFFIPAFYVISYIILLISGLGIKVMGISTLYLFTVMPAGFYALKYAVLPDIERGFISVMRALNICITVMTVTIMASQLLWIVSSVEIEKELTVVLAIIGILVTLFPGFLLERGAEKWTT